VYKMRGRTAAIKVTKFMTKQAQKPLAFNAANTTAVDTTSIMTHDNSQAYRVRTSAADTAA